MLKTKENEVDAQGKDLEALYSEIADKEREWAEEKGKITGELEAMRQAKEDLEQKL